MVLPSHFCDLCPLRTHGGGMPPFPSQGCVQPTVPAAFSKGTSLQGPAQATPAPCVSAPRSSEIPVLSFVGEPGRDPRGGGTPAPSVVRAWAPPSCRIPYMSPSMLVLGGLCN